MSEWVTSFLYTHPSLKFGLLTLLSKQPKKCSLWIEGAIHHLRLYFLVTTSQATAFCPFKLSNLQLIRHHPAVQPLRPWSEFQIGSRSLDPGSKDQQGISLSTMEVVFMTKKKGNSKNDLSNLSCTIFDSIMVLYYMLHVEWEYVTYIYIIYYHMLLIKQLVGKELIDTIARKDCYKYLLLWDHVGVGLSGVVQVKYITDPLLHPTPTCNVNREGTTTAGEMAATTKPSIAAHKGGKSYHMDQNDRVQNNCTEMIIGLAQVTYLLLLASRPYMNHKASENFSAWSDTGKWSLVMCLRLCGIPEILGSWAGKGRGKGAFFGQSSSHVANKDAVAASQRHGNAARLSTWVITARFCEVEYKRKEHGAAGSNFQLWSSLGCHHSGSIHTNTSYSSLLVPLLHICTCGVHLLWDAWWSLKFFFAEFSQRRSPNWTLEKVAIVGGIRSDLCFSEWFDHPGTSRYLPHSKSVFFAQGTTKRKRWRAFRSMARPALVRINVRAPSLTKPSLGTSQVNHGNQFWKSWSKVFFAHVDFDMPIQIISNHHTSIQHVQIRRNSTINSSNPSCLRAEDHSGSTWSSTLELNRLDGTTGKECQKLTWNSSIFYFYKFYTFFFIRFSMLGSFLNDS